MKGDPFELQHDLDEEDWEEEEDWDEEWEEDEWDEEDEEEF